MTAHRFGVKRVNREKHRPETGPRDLLFPGEKLEQDDVDEEAGEDMVSNAIDMHEADVKPSAGGVSNKAFTLLSSHEEHVERIAAGGKRPVQAPPCGCITHLPPVHNEELWNTLQTANVGIADNDGLIIKNEFAVNVVAVGEHSDDHNGDNGKDMGTPWCDAFQWGAGPIVF